MMDSRQALEAGLVDDLLYSSQLEGKLKGGFEEFRSVDANVYRNIDPASIGITEDARFALIIAEGSMNLGGSGESADFGKIAGSSTVNEAIHRALEDDDIEAIILRVNSPGGVWVAADVMWGELVKAMESKPVVVSMSDVAASGGYYIAMPASAIVAEPSTITGSIGVYVGKFNVSGLYDKIGVNREAVSRGKDAELFSELRDFSEEERNRVYQRIWDFYWNDFVMKAHEGRDLSPEFIDSVGRGKVWTGEQALEHGLVDELGGIWTAVEVAKEIAGIAPDKNVSLVLLPEPKDLFELLLEGDLVIHDSRIEIYPGMDKTISALQWMNLMGSGEILAMMPYMIEFD
jgi:protease-4